MKTTITIAVIISTQLMSGCTNSRYPNWQYVRIESTLPSPTCVYKIQESCSDDGNNCFEWHKKRATKYSANTVVITDRSDHSQFSTGFIGHKGSDRTTTLADYYECSGAKNIVPLSQ